MSSQKVNPAELKQLGVNIRRLRDAQGISRAQLAFEIGTTERQLSRIESGEINSGIMNYIRIARVLEVSFEELMKKIKLR